MRDVSNKQDVPIFKGIGDVDKVGSYTDTSLLQQMRTLCCTSLEYIPCEFNVDAKENKRIDIKRGSWFSSFVRISCGMKAIFQDVDDRSHMLLIGIIRSSPSVKSEKREHRSILVSSTNPKDLSKSALKY